MGLQGLQKTGGDGVDVTWRGRAFQVQGVMIGKAQSLPVECVCVCEKDCTTVR